MELISVIVPIYKVEQYLERCINSLVHQSYINMEIVLVDDGSPDRCGEICDSWAAKDSRIKVVHKKNGGLSDARNAGVEVAAGEYIAFVDSDDWLHLDYLQKLYQTMQETRSDIVECEIIHTTGEEEVPEFDKIKPEIYSPQDALRYLIEDRIFHQYVWNKLYKRKVIAGIFFKKGKTNEDEFWTYQVFGRANRVTKISEPLYFYLQRADSIMGTSYSIKRLDALEAKQQRQIYIDKNYPGLSAIAKINLFNSCIYSGQMSLKYIQGEERKRAQKLIDGVQKLNKPVKTELNQLKRKSRLWILLAKISFWGTCRVKNFLGRGI